MGDEELRAATDPQAEPRSLAPALGLEGCDHLDVTVRWWTKTLKTP